MGKKIKTICLQHVSSRKMEGKVGYFCYKYSVVVEAYVKAEQILPFFLSYFFCLIFFILEPPQFFPCILSRELCFQQLLSALSLLK